MPLTEPIFWSHFGSNCYEQNDNMYADVGLLRGAVNGTHFLSHFGSKCYEQNDNMYADVELPRG